MKRLLIALVLVMAFVTASWCATPTVTLTATYTDDNSAVDLGAIEPYREVNFSYSITADTPSVGYNFSLLTKSHNIANSGQIVSTSLPLIYELKLIFESEESGDVKMFISTTAGGSCSSEKHITVLHGEPPYVPVSGVKIGRAGYGTLVYPPSVSMDLEVRLGSTEELTAYVEPYNATNKNVIWSSDNEIVASVSSSGSIEGKYPGRATITATTDDGKFVASCDVIVIGYGADDMYINPSEVTLEVGLQTSVWIIAVNFQQYQFDSVKWTVSDDTIAQVYSSEYTRPSLVWGIKGLKAGRTTITATTINTRGEPMSASCTVIVRESEDSQSDNPSQPDTPSQPEAIGADTMYLNPSNVRLYVGGRRNLWLVAENITQTQFDTLKWTVSDNTVVSLIKNDNSTRSTRMWWLDGLKAGQAIITATTVNTKGETMSASCIVTVIDPMNSQPESPLDTGTEEPSTPETGAPQVESSSGGGGCNGLLGMVIMLPIMIFKRKR